MLTAERQDKILDVLAEKKYVSITELCGTLHFSESTLRRDIKRMERDRLLLCTRGGISAIDRQNHETPMLLRQTVNHTQKKAIARAAASLVQDGQIICMDASTTAMEMIPFLKPRRDLTIITCCLVTATRIVETLECTLICTGGRYHAPTAALTGIAAINSLRNWFADVMFFSCNSIDAVNGLTDQGEEIAQLKTAMLRQSKRAVLLADSSKFGRTASYRLSIDGEYKIITDPNPLFDADCWKEMREKIQFAQL